MRMKRGNMIISYARIAKVVGGGVEVCLNNTRSRPRLFYRSVCWFGCSNGLPVRADADVGTEALLFYFISMISFKTFGLSFWEFG